MLIVVLMFMIVLPLNRLISHVVILLKLVSKEGSRGEGMYVQLCVWPFLCLAQRKPFVSLPFLVSLSQHLHLK